MPDRRSLLLVVLAALRHIPRVGEGGDVSLAGEVRQRLAVA
jgi:hypothetical protein